MSSYADQSQELGDADKRTKDPIPDQQVKHLIVDDNSVNQVIFQKILLKHGAPSHKACNGKEAVEIYKADPAKCRFILMDQLMPVMDGITASRAIRDYEKENNLAPAFILFLFTAWIEGPDDAKIEQAKAEGGVDVAVPKSNMWSSSRDLVYSHIV